MLPLSSIPPRTSRDEDSSREPGMASQIQGLAPELTSYLPVIMEVLPAAVLVMDERFRMVVANAAARRLFLGDAFVGYSVGRFLSIEKLKVARLTLLSRAGLHRYKDVIVVDGVEREVEVHAEYLETAQGEFLCATLTDVSHRDRERAELAEGRDSSAPSSARIDHAQRLEALGHMTGSLAHDFNNLLSVILGSLEGAERRLRENRDPLEDILRAKKATERSIQTASEILRYARNRPGESEPICPRMLLEELRGLIERALGESVSVAFELAVTPRIRVGPAQLETAILNLIINARDAVEGGGEISVLLGVREFDEREAILLGLFPGSHVCISVVDSGQGMTDEVKKRVFEPFYTTKPQGRGTGLGLSTVRTVAQKYGGAIELDTSPGRGTRVVLIFPTV